MAEELASIGGGTLVTKADLERALAPIRADLALMKSGIGALTALAGAVLGKLLTAGRWYETRFDNSAPRPIFVAMEPEPANTRGFAKPAAPSGVGTNGRHPMPQFGATIKHLQEGVKGFTIAAAVKNIEGWEASLQDMDEPGVKNVVKDLAALKKSLQKDEIDGEAVKKQVLKLGKDTIALANKSDSKKAEQIKTLGEALNTMAEDEGEDEDAEEDGDKAEAKPAKKAKAKA